MSHGFCLVTGRPNLHTRILSQKIYFGSDAPVFVVASYIEHFVFSLTYNIFPSNIQRTILNKNTDENQFGSHIQSAFFNRINMYIYIADKRFNQVCSRHVSPETSRPKKRMPRTTIYDEPMSHGDKSQG